ncbi:MAG: GGDEF domain-containing protein [Planctomycetes bacterium]|nr:GGDEF domain-containing protein [Planctomycetota bacterium]
MGVTTESLDEIAEIVRLTLPLMAKHSIPKTPMNYTTWYNYVSGQNKELKETIGTIIEKKEPFSEKTNEMLYERFFVSVHEKAMNEIRKNLQETLLVVAGELTEISGQTKEYESTTLKSVDKLTEDMSVQDIKSVLNEVIVATKEIRTSGEKTQQRLKETTETMKVLQGEFKQAKTELSIDFLTGILNRKGFDETLAGTISETSDHLCLLVIDIDHFKKFNDVHGHIVGDEVLRFVAKNIQKLTRGDDSAARFGGEEFTVILPKTQLQGAMAVAENIRASFAKFKLEKKGSSEQLGTITVSIGAAQYRPNESTETFINRADQALYFAKNSGRNRVATESEVANQLA